MSAGRRLQPLGCDIDHELALARLDGGEGDHGPVCGSKEEAGDYDKPKGRRKPPAPGRRANGRRRRVLGCARAPASPVRFCVRRAPGLRPCGRCPIARAPDARAVHIRGKRSLRRERPPPREPQAAGRGLAPEERGGPFAVSWPPAQKIVTTARRFPGNLTRRCDIQARSRKQIASGRSFTGRAGRPGRPARS